MAVLTAAKTFDMSALSSGELSLTSLNTSKFTVDGGTFRQVFQGSYVVSDGAVESGTVTTLSIYKVTLDEYGNPVVTLVASFTGMNADAAVVWDYLDAGEWDGLWTYLFASDDTMTGSTAADVLFGYAGNDLLKGMGGRDSLVGGDGNDTLNGGTLRDTLVGGDGNDLYLVDRTLEVVVEGENQGTDTVNSSVTFTLSENVENLVLQGTKAINGTGNALDNTLTGNSAKNILKGGEGNDIYYIGVDDVVEEASNEGLDTVYSAATYTLGANIETLVLTGVDAINGIGNKLGNSITGNNSANSIKGEEGADTIKGGGGLDTIDGGVGNDVLDGQVGADRLIGWVGEDTLMGGDGNDKLYGDAVKREDLPENEDLVAATHPLTVALLQNQFATYADVAAAAEDLATVMLADSASITVTYASFTGSGEAASFFNSVNFDSSNMFQLGQGILLTTGDGSPALENTSTGYTQVNSQPGDETLDQIASTAFEGAGATKDAVVLEFKFTVAAGFEKVSLDLMFGSDEYPEFSDSSFVDIAAVEIDGVNYALFNNDPTQPLSVISENLGAGNFYDNKNGDLSIEYDGLSAPLRIVGSLDAGLTEHTIRIAIADTGDMLLDSGLFLSNLQVRDASYSDGIVLISGYDDLLMGGAGNDSLDGMLGQDTLDGGAGDDKMNGGAGDDVYVVDSLLDVITEAAGEGSDTVQSSITYTLLSNVENLGLTGANAINGVGNALGNLVSGNLAANTLSGLAGEDTLLGGDGNDTLVGGAGKDTLDGGRGNDQLDGGDDVDTVSYETAVTQVVVDLSKTTAQDTRAAGYDTLLNIENVIGGTANDYLFGNASDNVLDGGEGTDSMRGGLGNDTFIVDNEGDVVVELQNQGTDMVLSDVSWTLGACIENLTLTGTEDINATGNNPSSGGSGNNVIIGNAGSNVINGRGGVDTLTGGAGRDYFVFDTDLVVGEVEQITDFNAADDILRLDASKVFTAINAAAGVEGLPLGDYWALLGCVHFVVASEAQDYDDFLVYDSVTGALYYDGDGDGVGAATQFASLTPGMSLSAANFDIV